MPDPGACQPWWERAFGPGYLEIYAHRDDRLARDEVEAILPRLRDAPGPVLDACCGHARHLAELRAAGIAALGFDLSAPLLAAATRRPLCAGRLARCDVRAPAFASGWGAILLLFTAFGYFDDDGNAACLRRLARLLAPGGWLLLDLPEPEALSRCLVPRSERITAGGHEVVERRRIEGRRVVKDVAYRGEHYQESVRLYARGELDGLARDAELSIVEIWPSLRGADRDEGRQVVWLRR
jgi:SAM-dependent methyltransferase